MRELEQRLMDLETERQGRVMALEQRLAEHRTTLAVWDGREKSDAQRLLDLVLAARGGVKDKDIVAAFRRLDRLRRSLRLEAPGLRR